MNVVLLDRALNHKISFHLRIEVSDSSGYRRFRTALFHHFCRFFPAISANGEGVPNEYTITKTHTHSRSSLSNNYIHEQRRKRTVYDLCRKWQKLYYRNNYFKNARHSDCKIKPDFPNKILTIALNKFS